MVQLQHDNLFFEVYRVRYFWGNTVLYKYNSSFSISLAHACCGVQFVPHYLCFRKRKFIELILIFKRNLFASFLLQLTRIYFSPTVNFSRTKWLATFFIFLIPNHTLKLVFHLTHTSSIL